MNQAQNPYSASKSKSVPTEMMRRRGSRVSDDYDQADDSQPFQNPNNKSMSSEQTPRLHTLSDDKSHKKI